MQVTKAAKSTSTGHFAVPSTHLFFHAFVLKMGNCDVPDFPPHVAPVYIDSTHMCVKILTNGMQTPAPCRHGQHEKAGRSGTNPLLSDDRLVHIQKGYAADDEKILDGKKKRADDVKLDDHHSPLRADSYVLREYFSGCGLMWGYI